MLWWIRYTEVLRWRSRRKFLITWKVELFSIIILRAAVGKYELEGSLLKSISKKDLDSYLSRLPEPIKGVDGSLMSKSFNFPFKLVSCLDENYYKENLVTNQYLINEKLMCIKSGRMINSTLDTDEILSEIVKDKDFTYEFPTPVSSNFVLSTKCRDISSPIEFRKKAPKLI